MVMLVAVAETFEAEIRKTLRELGIPANYGSASGLPLFHEASELVPVGPDIYEREQRLAPAAATAWRSLQKTAEEEGVILLLVSGFRSYAYQKQIIERKLAAGQSLEQILKVNAAPGFSEHHTGRAVDLTAPGIKPLTEAFEQTPAFSWLARRAGEFGFSMTYPRNNRFGVVYEPWHWTFR
jgi:D-alanyl-D-alanine carboxypeptidase